MKLQRIVTLFLTGLLATGLGAIAYGQPLAPKSPKKVNGMRLRGNLGPAVAVGVPLPASAIRPGQQELRLGQPLFPGAADPSDWQAEVQAKLQQYQGTEETTKKSEIESEIRQLLSEQFDQRLKAPEQRIAESKKRLESLRKRIADRAQKSQEIVDLRFQVLIHRALGLGWEVAPAVQQGILINPYGKVTGQMSSGGMSGGTTIPGLRGYVVPYPGAAPQPYDFQSAGANGGGASSGYPDLRSPQSPAAPGGGAGGWSSAPVLGYPATADSEDPSINQLLTEYEQTEDKSRREALAQKLKEQLTEQFQKYQEHLNATIAGIEKQIEQLQENIDQRRQMKDSIVDLKLQTLINQARGLGF